MELEAIERRLQRCTTLDEMRPILDGVLDKKHIARAVILPEYFSTQESGILYRGSKCGPALKKESCTLARLSYPPPQYVKEHGRANRAGRSIFYCSDMEIGGYCELNLAVGNEVILSHWKLKEAISLMNIGRTRFASQCKPEFPPDIIREEDKKMHEWLTKLFTVRVPPGKSELYMPSVAITESLLHTPSVTIAEQLPFPYRGDNPGTAGIIYPCMKETNKLGAIDNLAIEPWFVDKNLTFVQAEHIVITAGREMEYDIQRLDHAKEVDEKGELIWKGYASRLYDLSTNEEYHILETPDGLVGHNKKHNIYTRLPRNADGSVHPLAPNFKD